MSEPRNLCLYRENLDNLPTESQLPEGYSIRLWTEPTQSEVDQILALFIDAFQSYPWVWTEQKVRENLLENRTIKVTALLMHSGEFVGMASGRLFEENDYQTGDIPQVVEKLQRDYPHAGRISWVAVLSKHGGKGLGYHITAAVLRFFKEQTNRTAALLDTQDYRISAIKTYLKLGFKKLLRDETHEARWIEIENKLQHGA